MDANSGHVARASEPEMRERVRGTKRERGRASNTALDGGRGETLKVRALDCRKRRASEAGAGGREVT